MQELAARKLRAGNQLTHIGKVPICPSVLVVAVKEDDRFVILVGYGGEELPCYPDQICSVRG